MPEYLAPGVYVEEVDTGSKPIEGVSTSTAGMVGVTERGPLDTPILITSAGEFRRWFGDRLSDADFHNANGFHCYLPHAVEGFFTNGGKRGYVTRILRDDAAASELVLFDRGTAASASSRLLRAARLGTGTAVQPPLVSIITPGALGANDWIRIGDGSQSEYHEIVSAPSPSSHVALNFPLALAHDANATIRDILPVLNPLFTAPLTLPSAVPAGAMQVTAQEGAAGEAAQIAAGQSVEIGSPADAEHKTITFVSGTGATRTIRLDSPLIRDYPAATVVRPLNVAGAVQDQLLIGAAPGDNVIFGVNLAGAFNILAHLVVIDPGQPQQEVRRIAQLQTLALLRGAYATYPRDSQVNHVAVADDDRVITVAPAAGFGTAANPLTLDRVAGLAPGQAVIVDPAGVNPEPRVTQSVDVTARTITLTVPLANAHAVNTRMAVAGKQLTVSAHLGDVSIVLDNRLGITAGDALLVGVAPDDEYVTVEGLVGSPGTPPDAGSVVLAAPLAHEHVNGAQVRRQVIGPPAIAHQPAFLVLGAHAGELIQIQAIDPGRWGDRLRISVENEANGLVSNARLAVVNALTDIELSSPTGVEAGTVLELSDPVSGAVLQPLIKVRSINRVNNRITLATPLTGVQAAAVGGLVRSREFRLTVLLMRRPDPAVPSRDDMAIDRERFGNLSMDPRHSRYFMAVIGDINGPLRLEDRRPEGSSWYVRTADLEAVAANREAVRLGPEALVDILPSGRPRAARHALTGGDDSIALLDDRIYIGADAADPENRTGLYTLKNVEEIAIIGVPGRTGPDIQGAMIAHCEEMRYRFAVLDGPRPPADSIADVRTQRQQFDTKYAALYHPWLLVPPPYPGTTAPATYLIPPSGHVLAIYARTDIERGVHKAPANEVVRGILGLQRSLTKGEQDILNPYPVNINVIRDFRLNNRGIRVWGGRVITSDSDWKYVNVRRLLIFIENSI